MDGTSLGFVQSSLSVSDGECGNGEGVRRGVRRVRDMKVTESRKEGFGPRETHVGLLSGTKEVRLLPSHRGWVSTETLSSGVGWLEQTANSFGRPDLSLMGTLSGRGRGG